MTETSLFLGDTTKTPCGDTWLLSDISNSLSVLDEFLDCDRWDAQLDFGRGRIVSARDAGLKSVKS